MAQKLAREWMIMFKKFSQSMVVIILFGFILFNSSCAEKGRLNWPEYSKGAETKELPMKIKEDIQKLYLTLDKLDAAGYGEFLTDNSVLRFGYSDPITGKEAIHEAQSDFFKLVNGMSHKLIRTWKDSNSLVVEGTVTYIRTDDSSITLPFVDIYEFEGEKISATLIYMDINPLFQSSE